MFCLGGTRGRSLGGTTGTRPGLTRWESDPANLGASVECCGAGSVLSLAADLIMVCNVSVSRAGSVLASPLLERLAAGQSWCSWVSLAPPVETDWEESGGEWELADSPPPPVERDWAGGEKGLPDFPLPPLTWAAM